MNLRRGLARSLCLLESKGCREIAPEHPTRQVTTQGFIPMPIKVHSYKTNYHPRGLRFTTYKRITLNLANQRPRRWLVTHLFSRIIASPIRTGHNITPKSNDIVFCTLSIITWTVQVAGSYKKVRVYRKDGSTRGIICVRGIILFMNHLVNP